VSNPDFRVPKTYSGVSQLPGQRLMVSVGLWDRIKGVGSAELVAGTTLHETGHNNDRWHGGARPVWNDATKTRYVEPNCKPNYTSIMSYLFQVVGERDDTGNVFFDYSRDASPQTRDLDEAQLSDGTFSPLLQPYRTAWFVPLTAQTQLLAKTLGASAAKRYCNGAPFPNPLPAGWVDMFRMDGPLTTQPVDWNMDGFTFVTSQDVNFDGVLNGVTSSTPPLHGYNDWVNLRLDQTGGGINARGFSVALTDDSGVRDAGAGSDDSGVRDAGAGSADPSTDDAGVRDAGAGVRDAGAGVRDAGAGEMDIERFAAAGYAPPNHLTACVIGTANCSGASSPLHRIRLTWKGPNAGDVASYTVSRSTGSTFSVQDLKSYSGITATTFDDPEELPNGISFTYIVQATFTDAGGGTGIASNPVTIVAVNDPPAAANDTYTMNQDGVLTAPAPGVPVVLANDTDADSINPVIRVTTDSPVVAPAHGSVTLNADGSFTYTPIKGFYGTDSFTYKAKDNRMWPLPPTPGVYPMSPDSAPATVTITVVKRKK
jgi:hypothetical protein